MPKSACEYEDMAGGLELGFSALLKGLTSVVVLRVERAPDIHYTYNAWRTWDSNPQHLGYKSDSLSIRPRLESLVHTIRSNSGFIQRLNIVLLGDAQRFSCGFIGNTFNW